MKNLKKFALLAFIALVSSRAAMAAEPAAAPIVTLDKEPANCKIHCVDAHATCAESAKVIELLKDLFQAYYNGDIEFVSKYIADDCTGFDDDHKLTVGKEAILEHIKKHIEKHKTDNDSPLESYTISSPYAQINGDTAIVTFVAMKDYGGLHPHRLVSHSTDIFVKRDGQWIKLHYRNSWKPAQLVSTSAAPHSPE